MTREKLDEILNALGISAVVFESPAYLNAHDGRLIYDYDKMIDCLMQEDNMTYEEAMEFIDYNTISALPYFPNAPIVLMHPASLEIEINN